VLQGGEVLQETIAANVTEEWVSLEFQRSDGTLVTQILDFKNVSTHNIYFLGMPDAARILIGFSSQFFFFSSKFELLCQVTRIEEFLFNQMHFRVNALYFKFG
jgi:Transcriptional regulator, Out at first